MKKLQENMFLLIIFLLFGGMITYGMINDEPSPLAKDISSELYKMQNPAP